MFIKKVILATTLTIASLSAVGFIAVGYDVSRGLGYSMHQPMGMNGSTTYNPQQADNLFSGHKMKAAIDRSKIKPIASSASALSSISIRTKIKSNVEGELRDVWSPFSACDSNNEFSLFNDSKIKSLIGIKEVIGHQVVRWSSLRAEITNGCYAGKIDSDCLICQLVPSTVDRTPATSIHSVNRVIGLN